MPVDLADPQQIQEFVDHARTAIRTIAWGVILLTALPIPGTTRVMSKAAIRISSSPLVKRYPIKSAALAGLRCWKSACFLPERLSRTTKGCRHHRVGRSHDVRPNRRSPVSSLRLAVFLCRAHEAQWAVGVAVFFRQAYDQPENGDPPPPIPRNGNRPVGRSTAAASVLAFEAFRGAATLGVNT